MPKVIITFQDNNIYFGELSKNYPDILFISIQNGIRLDFDDSHGGWKENKCVPHYYGFGEYEKDLLIEKKVKVENYIKSGSFKMGIFLSQNYNQFISDRYDICFVSYFRILEGSQFKKNIEITKNLLDLNKELFNIISDICLENKFSLCVAMISEKQNPKLRADVDYNLELKYYNNNIIDQKIDYIPNDYLKMDSYSTAMKSRCVIGLCSTLLFEVFGTKKRTLFGNLLFKPFYKYNNKLFKNMTADNILYKLDKKHIKYKIEKLNNMSDDEYIYKSAIARNYYMRCEEPYPHEMIKKSIAEKLYINCDH